MNITTGVVPKAQKVVLYGVEGIGKSTFAAQFPNPLFIDTEDSTLHMDVARFDKPTSWTMLLQQVEYVKQNKPCQTLVIDTIDWAEDLCKRHLMASNNWIAIDSEGYGKKFVALAKEMGELLNKLSDVVDVGINVVLTAHAWLRKKEEPDEMGAFDRYELKLEKKTAPLVKEWADMVLFANYKTTIITDSKTESKKATGGQRMMFTTHRPTWDAKNRVGLPDEVTFDYNHVKPVIENITNAINQPLNLQPQSEPTQQNEFINQGQPESQVDFSREPQQEVHPAIPQGLADLMRLNQVSTAEIMQVIEKRGIAPADMPVENVDVAIFNNFATKWDDVLSFINTQIRNF